MHEYLLSAASAAGDRKIITDAGGVYEGAELVDAADKLRRALERAGGVPGDRVLVRMEPSFLAVAAFCAVTSAGMIFVPVSPGTPMARARRIADSAGVTLEIVNPADADIGELILTERNAAWRWRDLSLSLGATSRIPTAPPPRPSEQAPAYIIFTSGTTGAPKGIVMSHAAAVFFWAALIDHCRLGPDDVVGSFAPIQFDFWLLDLGLAIAGGAGIAFLPRQLTYDPRAFAREMRRMAVTQLNGVPTIWLQMLSYAPTELAANTQLRSTLFAGDHFPAKSVRRLQALLNDIRIINCFGQSESIASTFFDLPNPLPLDMEVLPIGKGHEGVQYILVDEAGQPIVRAGQPGEMLIDATNLFSGYWRDAAQTRSALVPNPLAPDSGRAVFKSGDQAYFDDEGVFYYLGRLDHQVQIRGNRVELAEIARCAEKVDGVITAVALVEGTGGSGERIALEVKTDREIAPEAIKARLRTDLPDYMVPYRIAVSQDLSFTANGKLDRAPRTPGQEHKADRTQPEYGNVQ